MILHILCGIPGSGKSTISQRLNDYVVSTDHLRKCLWGDESIIKYDKLIFDLSEKIISYMLKNNDPVIFDATNLTKARRSKLINLAKSFNAQVILHWVQCPLEIAIERNLQRERKVPIHIIKALYNSFQEPTLEEGLDKIKIYNSDLNLTEVITKKSVLVRLAVHIGRKTAP